MGKSGAIEQQVTGVFRQEKRGGGVLLDAAVSYRPGRNDIQVTEEVARQYGLVTGARVAGVARPSKDRLALSEVASICDWPPDKFMARTRFEQLVAVDPTERFRLEASGNVSMRVVDLIAPIGKGTRGVIAAPPKSGKTQLLAQIAAGIHADQPETRILMLLVDERPEEVTQFRRTTPAEVLASSNDQSLD